MFMYLIGIITYIIITSLWVSSPILDGLDLIILLMGRFVLHAFFLDFTYKHVMHINILHVANCFGKMPVWAIFLILNG